MESRSVNKNEQALDFRVTITLATALTAVVLMLPFSINNFLQGRYQLGITSALIVIILLAIAWLIKIERLKPLVTSCILIPSILIFLYLSIQNQGIIGILWSFPALLSFYTMLPERHAWVANALLFALLSIVVWAQFNYEVSLRIIFTFAATSIFSIIFIRVITTQQEKLQKAAVTDPLTGVLNRTLLSQTLNRLTSHHCFCR